MIYIYKKVISHKLTYFSVKYVGRLWIILLLSLADSYNNTSWEVLYTYAGSLATYAGQGLLTYLIGKVQQRSLPYIFFIYQQSRFVAVIYSTYEGVEKIYTKNKEKLNNVISQSSLITYWGLNKEATSAGLISLMLISPAIGRNTSVTLG